MTTLRIRLVAQRIIPIGLAAAATLFVQVRGFPATAVGPGEPEPKQIVAGSIKLESGELEALPVLLDLYDDAKPLQGLSFAGRVVDLEAGTPIQDVSILVDRSLPGANRQAVPSWAGQSAIRTDAGGRFQLDFPLEQVAERGLMITLKVRHLGFIPRESWPINLATIVRRQALGDKPFFETIRLEKGVEYRAQIVTPTGKPAADVPFFFENWTRGNNDSPGFSNENDGRTDANGWFRLVSTKSQGIALYVLPAQPTRASFPYAPYRHFWGADRDSKHPDVWVPTDLGRIVLPRGVRLPGRVVDREGRPISGHTITAFAVAGRDRHVATTEADGTFTLGPLRYANYQIYGAGQDGFGGVDANAPSLPASARVITPVKVYLKEGIIPEPVVLREPTTVQVVVEFVDSRGKPGVGGPVKLTGSIPIDRGDGNPPARANSLAGSAASAMNDPEPEEISDHVDWGVLDRPDEAGRIVFHAPEGLQDARIEAHPVDETIAYKTRLVENGPLKYWGGGQLGRLDADRTITIVSYRAPMVLLTVKTDDGSTPAKLDARARFTVNTFGYAEGFHRQTDGRFRAGLMPDHEYRIFVASQDLVPTTVPRLNLPEGGRADLTVILRKRPKPPETGKPAPTFSVQTIDGKTLALGDLRGKFVLLHFWAPHPVSGLTEFAHLKALADRFEKDDRLTMVSLCIVDDREIATKIIKNSGLSLVQVILGDQGLEPMSIDYHAHPVPKSFLISPDGTLIAKDLKGDQIEKAVTEALSRNVENEGN
jgi:peroxiredoxin